MKQEPYYTLALTSPDNWELLSVYDTEEAALEWAISMRKDLSTDEEYIIGVRNESEENSYKMLYRVNSKEVVNTRTWFERFEIWLEELADRVV